MDLDLSNEVDEIINSEIGIDAILTTATPSEITNIRVIFHKEYSVEDNLETQWEAFDLYAECKAGDVENALQDDTITINGVNYNIESIEPAQGGWTILRLTQ